MSKQNEKAKRIITEVIKRASMDEAYRKLVLKDPKKAIKEVASELIIPESYTVKFVEPDPEADETIVLPPLQTEDSDEDEEDNDPQSKLSGRELNEKELDDIAGGRGASYNKPEECMNMISVNRVLGKGEDCEILNTLRKFRDNWLRKQSYGPALIDKYYNNTTKVVRHIENSDDPQSIYEDIWYNYIKVYYEYILQSRYTEAVEKYREMDDYLQKTFALSI